MIIESCDADVAIIVAHTPPKLSPNSIFLCPMIAPSGKIFVAFILYRTAILSDTCGDALLQEGISKSDAGCTFSRALLGYISVTRWSCRAEPVEVILDTDLLLELYAVYEIS